MHRNVVDRRRFLKFGAALTVLPFMGGDLVHAAAARRRRPVIRLHRIVYDERFQRSLAFAGQCERFHAATRAICGDVTDVWYHDLDLRWRAGRAPIAGMTTGDALFCLERLAWDRGMRVVFRAEHRCLPAGYTEHVLRGPEPLLCEASELTEAGADWPDRIGNWVARCPCRGSRIVEASALTAPEYTAADRQPLVSWVIA